MLIEGSLEYRKPVKGPAVFEKIEENILSQKKKSLIDSGKINLQARLKNMLLYLYLEELLEI